VQTFSYFRNLFGRYLPFKGAAEGGGDGSRNFGSVRTGKLRAGFEPLDQFGRCFVEVRLRMRFAGRNRELHLVHSRSEGAFHSLEIGDKRSVLHTFHPADGACYLVGIGHLRNRLWIDVRAYFHDPDPGVDDALDQADFPLDGERGRLVLKTVAGADFTKENAFGQCHGHCYPSFAY